MKGVRGILLPLLALANLASGRIRIDRDLVYAKAGNRELRLDLYRPATVDGPLPVIVSIHGGGWEAGGKEQSPGTGLAAQGYAVAAIEVLYAGAQGQYPGLDQVNVRVPPSLAGSGEIAVSLAADGQRANRLTMNIR